MNLIDNDVKEEDIKARKVAKLIIIILVMLIILVAVLLYLLIDKSQKELKVKLDGQTTTKLSQYMIIDEETGEIKVEIKGMATALGYEAYDGEYNTASQDNTKCYIQYTKKNVDDQILTNCEITGYELDSKEIYKVENEYNTEYQYFTLQDKVEQIDDKLYTSIEGIQKGLNIYFNYDVSTNTITINTLSAYKTSVANSLTNIGYQAMSDNFSNEKALLSEMIVVYNEEQAKYGVVTFDGSIILDVKYDDIRYIESENHFIVISNQKVGIIGTDKKTKISTTYDELTKINNRQDIYLVKKDNYYGVVDENEKVIIYMEYEQIGLQNEFTDVEIDNNIIIKNKYIPLKKAGKYGVYDIDGNMILPLEYEEIGSTTDMGNNTLIIQGYNVIVVKKDGRYGLMNFEGKEVIPCVLDTIYSELQNGKTVYYMVQGDNVINIINYLDKNAPQEKETIEMVENQEQPNQGQTTE